VAAVPMHDLRQPIRLFRLLARRAGSRRRSVLVVSWLAAAGAVALAATVVVGSAGAKTPPCPRAHPLAVPTGEHDPNVQLPTLKKSNEDDELEIPFDDSRDPDSASVPLDAPDWNERLAPRYGLELVLGTSYLRRSRKNEIPATDPGLRGSMLPLGAHRLALCLSVTPHELTRVRPGRYVSSLVVDASPEAQQLVTVPVELTFRASRWLALGVALLGFLLGIAVKVLSEAAAIQRERMIGAGDALSAYRKQLVFTLGVVLGAISGAFIFHRVYISNPVWGENSGDLLTLFGLCFLAQLGSNEGINIVRRAVMSGPTPQAAPEGS
jgi:hypothetical protein